MSYITLDNLPLYYELQGQGTGSPVVFINGWCQSARYWDETAHALAKERPVLLFDSRGFGRSLPQGRRFPDNFHASIDEGRREAWQLIEKLELTAKSGLHILGHSLGAVTAVHLASQLQQAGKLRSLTIVNSGSFEPNVRQGDTLNTFVKVFVRLKRFFNLPLLRNLILARSVARPIPERYIRIIAEDFEVCDARLALELSLSSLQADNLRRYRQELVALTLPLLLMVGDRDATIPPAGMYNIKRFKPQSELVSFPDCGHLPMLEQPQRFTTVLTNHLQTADHFATEHDRHSVL